MNAAELNRWIETLGWTLLHSLWQGTIAVVALMLFKKIFHRVSPAAKYVFGIASLSAILLSSGVTFYFLFTEPVAGNPNASFIFQGPGSALAEQQLSLSSTASQWLNSHLHQIVTIWSFGAMIFALRLMTAWWAARNLKLNALAVSGEWLQKLYVLADQLDVRKKVYLAESARIDAPILLGYLKPVILLPLGMLSGLTTEQVESILLHELAHIRRHDYLINFLQSTAEVVFFFNPFVWIISSELRLERELCCDDIVVKLKNPLVYAQALHQLEEARLHPASVVLAAAGSTNKLLQRIQRIMEPTEKKKQTHGKAFPALLVILALIGTSWVSIQANSTRKYPAKKTRIDVSSPILAADTSKKEKLQEKSSSYSRKSITTLDENGGPHEVVTESFDEDPALLMEVPEAPEFAFEFEIPEVPPVPMEPFSGIMAYENFAFDTLPEDHMIWRKDISDLRDFERQFSQQFQNQFGDFYKKNKAEIDKMMNEVQKNIENIKEETGNRDRVLAEQLRERDEMERSHHSQGRETAHQREEFAKQEAVIARAHTRMSTDLQRQARRMNRFGSFEKVLSEELVKDGYLGKDETIKNINWKDDGNIEVNGKKIKEQDKSKYQDLHAKYFNEGHVGHAE
jgi:bla regulator protein blaR1